MRLRNREPGKPSPRRSKESWREKKRKAPCFAPLAERRGPSFERVFGKARSTKLETWGARVAGEVERKRRRRGKEKSETKA
eukprot:scaffold165945_cov26-Tisochrysis_lutea.AAC.2